MSLFDIPEGHYCYKIIDIRDNKTLKTETCQFWHSYPEHGEQNSGYCSYLDLADWESEEAGSMTFLWDKVKECGINVDTEGNDE